MKQRRWFFLLALLCSAYSFGFIPREEDPLKNLLSKLQKYHEKNPQEKVHIHTDKPYYSIGDSIWFKVYVVNAEENQLSALSKIVYVDLINDKDSIKKSLRLPVTSGLAWGDFVLSDSLTEGNYRIRAYTTWMRNFGEDFYFDKTIQIGNALSNSIISNVEYSFSKIGVKENVTANISYTDLEGKPIAKKEVTYNIQLDFRNIASGKGLTDEQGKLQVKFTNAQPFILKSGKINTTVKLDEKTFVRKVIPVKATSAEMDVQFFPEGGQLVKGLRSKVGIKALAADGIGQEASGTILDKDNNAVAEFRTEHAGMGVFTFIPLTENTYTAQIRFKDGSEKKVELPKVESNGYILSVNNSDPENLQLKVSASADRLETGELIVVGQQNGVVAFAARNKLTNTVFSSNVPKKRFRTGILQLTLFSPDYRPVAERLVFIDNNDYLNLDISTDKASYGSRDKVELNVESKDASGKPVRGNFSVSVVNESVVPFDDSKETTILSNLLLSSDLKGYIENPNYYFTEVGAEKRRHLDNLMLTQGWRRLTWNNIISNSYPNTVYNPERSIVLSGRVTTASDNPVVGGKVTVLASKGNAVVLDTITDADGRFRFDSLSFSDSTSFVVQARNAKGKKNVYIDIDRIPAQMVTKNRNSADVEINVNQSLITYLKSRENDFALMRKNGLLRKPIMLAEVKVVQKKPVLTNSSNLNGAGNADAIIKADRLQNCLSLAQCLQGMVAGVVVQNGIAYSTRSMYSSFSGLVPMQLIIDGMYVEPDYLSIIPPNDVESIEVLKSGGNTAIYGIRGGGGVLIINTKRGERNLSYRGYAPGIASFSPQGLYYSREFYSPVYSSPKTEADLPDLRNTIYWTPNILTDSNGKASLSFFTADAAGTYKVTIEGLSFDGTLVHRVYRLKVK